MGSVIHDITCPTCNEDMTVFLDLDNGEEVGTCKCGYTHEIPAYNEVFVKMAELCGRRVKN